MDEEEIRRALEEICDIQLFWLKLNGVPIRKTQFSITPALRDLVNTGAQGCWQCGTTVDTDKDQPWTADHIPPRNLPTRYLRVLKNSADITHDGFYLFPQCQDCSGKQAALVRYLKQRRSGADSAIQALSIFEISLLTGGAGEYIYGTPNLANNAERLHINALGKKNGCHTCGIKFPVSSYVADHYPPQEVMTYTGEQVFKAFKVDYPQQFYLLPHCRRCSNAQGSYLKKIFSEARKFLNITKLQ